MICIWYCSVQGWACTEGSVFYYTMNEQGNLDQYEQKIIFYSPFTSEEKASILFENLFCKSNSKLLWTAVPPNTTLIGLQLSEGHLVINVSKEIKEYGGSSWEQMVEIQLLDTAFSLDTVDQVTVRIEGKLDVLPEGTQIDHIWRQQWKQERMRQDGEN
jgi:spore germination protein GerM